MLNGSGRVLAVPEERLRSLVLASAMGWGATEERATSIAWEVSTAARDAVHLDDEERPQRYQLRTAAELETMEPPPHLVGELLFQNTLASLFGAPGSGKSLLALDWSCCIRTGRPWIRHETRPGAVVYVAAEGSAGIGARLRAWRDYQAEPDPIDVHFVLEAVPLMQSLEVDRLLRQLATLPEPPALIVFDTLARCLVGGDENSSMDVGLLIAGADRIRTETGATVLILHHTNKGGDVERGSSALRGAVDTLISLKAEDGVVTLKAEKQKDAAPFDPIPLILTAHLDSAVFGARSSLHLSAGVTAGALALLRLVQEQALPEGLTSSEWEDLSGLPRRTFFLHRKALWDKGLIHRDHPGRGARYTVTQRGKEAVGA